MEDKNLDKERAEHEAEKERYERELDELFEIIKFVTPGSKLRTAIDSIADSGRGGLIVMGDSSNVVRITNGGFKINCKFTPQKLVELSKMDGAIILSEDLKKIVYCNTLLVPDHTIETNETGTRLMAAERTAKQTSKPVITISERKKTINLYFKNTKYMLRKSTEVLNKVIETLRMLEKHKEMLDELLINLNTMEFNNLVNLNDVVSCIQRMELISKVADKIKRYLIELGDEGNLAKILLKEVIKGIKKEKELLLMDYSRNWEFTKTALTTLKLDELSEPENIVRVLLYSSILDPVAPIGYRILSKISINQESKNALLKNFKTLQYIINAIEEPDKIIRIIGDKDTNKLIKELNHLKESALIGKKI